VKQLGVAGERIATGEKRIRKQERKISKDRLLPEKKNVEHSDGVERGAGGPARYFTKKG